LLKQIKAAYDAALYERQMTDFDTIISRTAEIVGEITHDFRYIMVDEFQDTNLTQYEIVRRLAEGRNLFVVGDSKQSIYAFQGAEIEVFNNAVTRAPFSGGPVNMSVNYRSDGVVLDTVNRIFEKLLAKNERLKLIAQNFEATPQKLEVSKPEKRGKGSFRYLIASNEYEEEEKLDEMQSIAQFLEDVVRGRQEAYEEITRLIDGNEKAVAVLFDSRTQMLELKRILRERGIDAKVSASENFYHTKEINAIFNVLKAAQMHSKMSEKWTEKQRYFIAGALRSNILKVEDDIV
jgi:ATP-dependent exoDNAse (exonuclease V) beta subunit